MLRARTLLASILVGGLALCCGESETRPSAVPAKAARPHILLVVIDTLRADHVGAYGYPRPTTPNLDALAAEGTLFTHAFSTSSWTKPAIASLFTSLLPSEHGAVAFERHLGANHATLAGRLSGAGYLSIGVSGNFVHVTKHTGLARGFARWKSLSFETDPAEGEAFWSQAGEGETQHFRPAHAGEVNQALLALLPRTLDRPLFLYAHYMEPHSDYAPPDGLRARFERAPTPRFTAKPVTSNDLIAVTKGEDSFSVAERQHAIDLYDAEIAAADAALGALLASLEQRGIADPLVVVTSDHGEEFGEHGAWFHAIQLHRESLAVPLVIRDPGREGGARRVEPVTLTDLAPTLLDRAGVPVPESMRGRPLLSHAAAPEARHVVAELHRDPPFEEHVLPRSHRLSVQSAGWKVLLEQDGSVHAYHLDADPEEQHEEGADGSDAAALADAARTLLATLEASLEEADPAPLSPEEREGLQALGYAAGPAAAETGEALYRRLPCAGCHEAAAVPGMSVQPLEGLSERYDVDALAALLADPPSPMPSFDLDEAQRRRLAEYLLAAHP